MIWIIAASGEWVDRPSKGESTMTRERRRAKEDWEDERVALRVELHLLEESGVFGGPRHLEISTRIKELSRLISEAVGFKTARG